MNEVFPYHLDQQRLPQVGLVVLKSDETVERDFRDLLPPDVELLVTRVPAADEVTLFNLTEIRNHLSQAVSLFPTGVEFASLGYACTSGSAALGVGVVEGLLRSAARTRAVSNPLSALLEACSRLGVRRLGILSPYAQPVSDKLCEVLRAEGLEVPVTGCFTVPQEAMVVRIDAGSILFAAAELARKARVDALFLSCTNLRTIGLLDRVEEEVGLPVFSSNQVLAWHMMQQAGLAARGPGRLFRVSAPAGACA
ncbi:maleate cis-trans isomerase family protein [Oceanicola sp. S124]|uniref:maleate cis-trans isomerase family protein n=1 Tax=Oceanicola sp. S124 TaxID=1042378 RepID=UPI000255857A|nr:aspartate/glutamate racemase family protein [Oceanicola sp. S124]